MSDQYSESASPLFDDLHSRGIELVVEQETRAQRLRADATFELLKDEIRRRAVDEVAREQDARPHLRVVSE